MANLETQHRLAVLEAEVRELEATLVERTERLATLKLTADAGALTAAAQLALEQRGLLHRRHVDFVLKLDEDKNTFAYCATEHLRMQGVFWGLGAMSLLGRMADMEPLSVIVDWVFSCYHADSGGFSGNVGHDAHLLYTQHAVYVLAQCNALDRLDVDCVAAYIANLQNEDGSFRGDEWGEVDTRFSYCAVAALAVLGRLDVIDLPKAMRFIVSCRNFDGGFGSMPGAESHAGYVFTAVGALSIGGAMDLLPEGEWDKLAWWLSERQCDSGGLNGRPEKQADVCYSWWVLSALHILGRLDWIDCDLLVKFILRCQDPGVGGIADRPGNVADVYHSFFGISGLSMLGFMSDAQKDGLGVPVNPVFALPQHVVDQLGLKPQVLTKHGQKR